MLRVNLSETCPGCSRRFSEDLYRNPLIFQGVTTHFCDVCIDDARKALGLTIKDVDFTLATDVLLEAKENRL